MKSAGPATRPPVRSPAGSPAQSPWCALVGAGPGDPELLTLRAIRLVRRATVLLVDDLVSDAVLERALKGAKRRPRIVHVGKRGGCRSTPQAFITKLMVSEALAGERVVRFKGGDPFVFGRGGEEAEALRAHGITVEIGSGITAAVAASAGLGVPLTHRAHAHGVMLVTGHAKPGGAPLHWPTLAAAAAQGLTLVIYMGVAEWPQLQAGLLQGLPAGTPAAVVQHASLPQQRQVVTVLGDLAETITREQLGSPAIIIVGDVLQGALALAGQPAGLETPLQQTVRQARAA
ncbi:uroporphyrinogen-III C-methyltransferase [Aquabacterium humicola]|uniref:uroporphyrinogen-III C-methyltransferase n=1 Tax=Aquabacterium humicola TaxID=3237377 RepID=UPI002542F1FF|nr:uroporphyrinogen-III C-methyltransferase [Rubrivivax pictus]